MRPLFLALTLRMSGPTASPLGCARRVVLKEGSGTVLLGREGPDTRLLGGNALVEAR